MKKVSILDIEAFEQDQQLADFYCNRFENHLHTHHKAISVPHKHNFFLTVFVSQGSGFHEVDFEKYDVKPGSVFMLSPGQTHYWELSDDIKGIILFHSKEFFDVSFTHHSIYNFPFFYSVHNSSALFLSHTQQEHFQTLFSQILKENESQKMLSRQKIVSLLNCLYIDLSRIYINTQNETILRPGKYAEHLRALEELIETHYKTLKSASDYANMLNITMRHLNRLTQQALNKSTTQLITERVILEAKRLIAYDSSSMTKIAYDLGYNDYTYFSRLFKKWTGQTPSEFSESYKPR